MTDLILDPSKMKDAMRCMRYFYYRHVLGWAKEGVNHNLIFGSAWHKAMEVLLLKGYSSESIEEAYQAFLDYYRQSFSEETDLDYSPKDPGNVKKALTQYVSIYGSQDKFKNIWTEILAVVPIDNDKVMHMRIDSVNKDDRGVFCLEHKTSKYLSSWWHDQWLLDFQVEAYTHFLYSQFPEKEVYGLIINGAIFRKGSGEKGNAFPRVPIRKTMANMQDWLLDAQYWYSAILYEVSRLWFVKEGDSHMLAFPRNRTNCVSYGRTCQFHDICHAWHNPERFKNSPPLGFVVTKWDPRNQEGIKKKFDLTKKGT